MFKQALLVPTYEPLAPAFQNSFFSLRHFAESLVFYDTVHLAGRPEEIHALIFAVGPAAIYDLLAQDRLLITPLTEVRGSIDRGEGCTEFLISDEVKFLLKDLSQLDIVDDAALNLKIQRKIEATANDELSGRYTISLKKLIEQEQETPHLLQSVASKIVLLCNGELPGSEALCEFDDYTISVRDLGIHYTFDYGENPFVDPAVQDSHLPPDSISTAGLGQCLDRFVRHLAIAAADSSEFCAHQVLSGAITSSITDLYVRAGKSEEISVFQDIVFEGASIGASIGVSDFFERRARFEKLVKLLEKKEKFSTWIRGANPDASLISEYLRALTADSPFDNPTAKTSRFVFFTGAGLAIDAQLMGAGAGIPTAAGIALGAFDTFIFDRIFRGWRPNQFVEGPLREFVAGDRGRPSV